MAPAEALTAAGLQRRLATGREDDAVDPGRLGAAQQRADVLRILERIEDEDERRLVALRGTGQDVVERREPARLDDERDALVAVEPGDRGQRAALDLDDRDAQPGRVEDELLEGVPALRDDQQAMGGPAGREDLLDRAAAGDQLLVGPEQVRRREGGAGRGHGARLEARARPGSRRCAGRSRWGGSGRRTVRRAPDGGPPGVPPRSGGPLRNGGRPPADGGAPRSRGPVRSAGRSGTVGRRRHRRAVGVAPWAGPDRAVRGCPVADGPGRRTAGSRVARCVAPARRRHRRSPWRSSRLAGSWRAPRPTLRSGTIVRRLPASDRPGSGGRGRGPPAARQIRGSRATPSVRQRVCRRSSRPAPRTVRPCRAACRWACRPVGRRSCRLPAGGRSSSPVAAGQPRPASTVRRQRCPSRVSSTVTPRAASSSRSRSDAAKSRASACTGPRLEQGGDRRVDVRRRDRAGSPGPDRDRAGRRARGRHPPSTASGARSAG